MGIFIHTLNSTWYFKTFRQYDILTKFKMAFAAMLNFIRSNEYAQKSCCASMQQVSLLLYVTVPHIKCFLDTQCQLLAILEYTCVITRNHPWRLFTNPYSLIKLCLWNYSVFIFRWFGFKMPIYSHTHWLYQNLSNLYNFNHKTWVDSYVVSSFLACQLFWPLWCRARKCNHFAAVAVRMPTWR